MRKLRIALLVYLMIFSIVYIKAAIGYIWLTDLRQKVSMNLFELFNAALLLIVAVTIGMACWTAWKKRVAARKWAIAASVLNLFVMVGVPLDILRQWGWGFFWKTERLFWAPTAIGFAALIVFISYRQMAGGPGFGDDGKAETKGATAAP